MEFVFEKIFVPHKHSFISQELQLGENTAKIHSHKNFELNLITSGAGRRIVGDNISSFEKGDLVLLGPDLPHCWEVLESKKNVAPTCIVTHFYENIISSDFFNIPELEEVMNLLKKANYGISFRVKKNKEINNAIKEIVHLKGLDCYIGLLKVFNLLLKIEDREYLSNPQSHSKSFSKNLSQINKVYEYVFLNIHKGIKLDEAASILNMAPSSFCRYFKKKTNTTFMEYVKTVRVGMAAKMLAETDKQITQICYDSGYNSLANFNHYFKDIFGETPSDYRKNYR